VAKDRKSSLWVAASLLALVRGAHADPAGPSAGASPELPPGQPSQPVELAEIVVTAQKRTEKANDVPISIDVVDSQQLQQAGVRTAEDLYKVVPGLTFTETQFDAPVFALRGVGFNDSSLAAAPTVSVYVDQVPLPYSAMARGGLLDLDHVEVLEGPQGTLFGENSTGGAINLIAAKPTDILAAGAQVSYGSFDTVHTDGFVSGPVANGLTARLAISADESGPWQQSTTRDASLGDTDIVTGRLLLDYNPSDTLRIAVNLNGWHDGSDTQAAQFVGLFPAVPGPLPPAIANEPLVTSPRAADWSPGESFQRNNRFYQGSIRADWNISSDLTLTSLSSYDYFVRHGLQDASGTPTADLNIGVGGGISTFNQELRLAGNSDRLHWIVGGNYEQDRIHDQQTVYLGDSPASYIGPFHYSSFFDDSRNTVKTYAAFDNVEYNIVAGLSATAGVRYTKSDTDYKGCSLDSGAGDLAALFGYLQTAAFGVPATATPGHCVTLLANGSTGYFADSLNQDNVSWRVGLNYKFESGSLVYTSISRGYKAGGFPTLGAQSYTQLEPVTQEQLTSYEVGFKTPLFARSVQLNAAAFYYTYDNKQVLGSIEEPIFGQLQRLVNIPRSQAEGAELSVQWTPVRGLNLNASGTYLHTEIDKDPDGSDFVNYTQFGTLQSFTGERFPFTPAWQLNAGVSYTGTLSGGLKGFVGADVAYRSSTNGGLGDDPRLAIDAYTLLNLKVGVKTEDGRWSISVYGKNVTNSYYWNNALHVQDTIVRYVGMPAQYGVTLGYVY
jgi:iron complex outermembrane recepter protein